MGLEVEAGIESCDLDFVLIYLVDGILTNKNERTSKSTNDTKICLEYFLACVDLYHCELLYMVGS